MTETVSAAGTDAHSQLAAAATASARRSSKATMIDDDDDDHGHSGGQALASGALDDEAIEMLLKGLAQAPLGLTRDNDLRISVTGAEENDGAAAAWRQIAFAGRHNAHRVYFKTPIGEVPNGMTFRTASRIGTIA